MPLSKLTKAQLIARINEVESNFNTVLARLQAAENEAVDLSIKYEDARDSARQVPAAPKDRGAYYAYVGLQRTRAKRAGFSACRYLPYAAWLAQVAA